MLAVILAGPCRNAGSRECASWSEKCMSSAAFKMCKPVRTWQQVDRTTTHGRHWVRLCKVAHNHCRLTAHGPATAFWLQSVLTWCVLLSIAALRSQLCRYKNFLGLNNPNDFMAAAASMKAKGDFTNLRDDKQAIAAVRAEGMAADKVLAISGVEEGAAAAR